MLSHPSAMMGAMSDDPRRRLGRGVIVDAGDPVPGGWDGAERVLIDEAVLAAPADALARLHRAWTAREPVVVDLGIDVGALRTPEVEDRPPHALTPTFEFARERLVLPRARQQLRRASRSTGVGPGARGDAVRRTRGRCARCRPARRHARVDRRRPARRCRGRCRRRGRPSGAGRPRAAHARRRRADRRRPRTRSARGRRPQRRPGAHHRPRRLRQDAGPHGAVPVAGGRSRLGAGAGVRGRVQRARQRRDGAAPHRCRAGRAPQDPHVARTRLRRGAAGTRHPRRLDRVGRAAPDRTARPGPAAPEHRHARALPRSARRGAARPGPTRARRGPARRRRRVRGDVRPLSRRSARRRGDGPRRTDLRRARSAAHERRHPARAASRVPAPPRRRVPGPHARAALDAAPRRGAGLRRVRRR